MFMTSANTFYPNTLGGSRPRRHIAPQLRAAGVSQESGHQDVMASMKQQEMAGTGVPPRRPRGPLVKDPAMTAGVKGEYGAGAEVCIKPDMFADKMKTLVGEQRDRRYLSNIRAPLGRVPDPKHAIPEDILRRGFGVKSAYSESAGRLLYEGQQGALKNPPGVQANRQYDWAGVGIDPSQHVFGGRGGTGKGDEGCIAELLGGGAHWAESTSDPKLQTVVLPKITQDFKSTLSSHQLAGGAKSMAAADSIKAALVGGNMSSYSSESHLDQQLRDARKIAASNGSPNVTAVFGGGPDGVTWGCESSAGEWDDVGRPTVASHRLRKLMKEERERRVQEEEERQLAALNRSAGGQDDVCLGGVNGAGKYGDDITVPQLLYPCYYVKDSIKAKYYAGGRTYDDCRAMALKLKFGLSEKQMQQAFKAAADASGLCGIEQFKNSASALGFY